MGFLHGTKADILRMLSKGPRHGYAIARELKLTLSTVYEHIYDLEAEGLVVTEDRARRRDIRLTPRGRALVDVLIGQPFGAGSKERGQRSS